VKLGIIGGIHEDVLRLKEALAVLRERGCSVLACLGDITGYGVVYYDYPDTRDAHACVQLVKENCRHAVVGNHDLFAIRKIPRQTSFQYPDNWYALDVAAKEKIARNAVYLYEDDLPASLNDDDRDYLAGLPEYGLVQLDETSILISHYAYPNLVGDGVEFDPSENDGIQQHFRFMTEQGCSLAVFNHDLCDGARIFSEAGIQELPFGRHPLPAGMVALNGSWVANSTSPNGVLILDPAMRHVEAIPLNTPIHKPVIAPR